MTTDPEMHQELLSDALKLLEGGSITAAADALRSAIELEFRPDVAEIIGRIEERIKTGGRADDIVADLRDAVEDSDFFGSDVVVEDGFASPGPKTAPRADSASQRQALEQLKRKVSEVVRDSRSESGRGTNEFDDVPTSHGRRYLSASPPPPPHRRGGLESAGTGRKPDGDVSDDLDLFGDIAGGGQPAEDFSFEDIEPPGPPVAEEFSDLAPTSPSLRTGDHLVPESPDVGEDPPVTDRPSPRDSTEHTPTTGSPAVGQTGPAARPADQTETDKIRPAQAERGLPTERLVERAKGLMGRGDLASALELLGEVLRAEPGNGEALDLRDDVNHRLGVLRLSALEPLDRVPSANLDAAGPFQGNHRALYLLTMADGSLTLQDLIDLSGLSTTEAAALLSDLLSQGALRFG